MRLKCYAILGCYHFNLIDAQALREVVNILVEVNVGGRMQSR